ncbi:Phosphatidylinositol 3,5-bisphosphate-binding protein [Cadophora gregata]|uniref:Phosphatidylinositol 3,5-bisphosphate-binding protein n=1 Tax=Cadophora gregata TaxID=51156 RepID=UPI0026DC8C1C|nr:Phosphatidylinositol 3,5-bisphosphate-binding protein [Cadophora gregata]KAK0105129.1 Phosphatidylinositol 3,5-bisphosphate-binding protein [Cadophora gregata f. sp. sojae]KAK0106002.1 Phosphatidylinositol 3,5-bisphosphate-binding protein [Cadophora gregata]
MNTRPAIESESSSVALSASFNHDASCFSVGLNTGFCIFNSEPCQLRVSRDFNAGIGAAQMLGKANFIALIGGGRQPKFPQNKVIIWDDAKQQVAIQIPVLTTVRGVRLSRTHVIVALQNSVRVYKFKSPPELWSVFETADNPLGLCCLTPTSLAFPGRTPGQVQLVELSTGNGTLIRVFATSNCARIAELRRGVDHATIFSLSIAPSGQLLAVTSDKSTLHVFDIPHPSKPPRTEAPTLNRRLTTMGGGGGSPGPSDVDTSQKWGILGRIPLLPRVFSDVYSFASAHFEIGDELLYGSSTPLNSDAAFRPPKGILGWTSDHSIIVIGAGRDGRWEKFVIAEGEDGRRYCVRDGWKRYLGAN